jgi:hypothetical protein
MHTPFVYGLLNARFLLLQQQHYYLNTYGNFFKDLLSYIISRLLCSVALVQLQLHKLMCRIIVVTDCKKVNIKIWVVHIKFEKISQQVNLQGQTDSTVLHKSSLFLVEDT